MKGVQGKTFTAYLGHIPRQKSLGFFRSVGGMDRAELFMLRADAIAVYGSATKVRVTMIDDKRYKPKARTP